jgi:hypothetical protein
MKVAELKQIIEQQVRQAVRLELKDLIQEAITIASTVGTEVPATTNTSTQVTEKRINNTPQGRGYKPIEDLLEETKLSFTSADAKSFITQDVRQELVQGMVPNSTTAVASKLGMIGQGDAPGIDLNALPFLKNAKQILNKSIVKDKERLQG